MELLRVTKSVLPLVVGSKGTAPAVGPVGPVGPVGAAAASEVAALHTSSNGFACPLLSRPVVLG